VPVERLEDVLWTAQVADCVPGGAFHNLSIWLLRDNSRYIESNRIERGNIEKIERAGCKDVAKGSLYATYRLAQKGQYCRTRDERSITF
jgi:hypothetical protein